MAKYPDAPCSGAKRFYLAAFAALTLGTTFTLAGTVQTAPTCDRREKYSTRVI